MLTYADDNVNAIHNHDNHGGKAKCSDTGPIVPSPTSAFRVWATVIMRVIGSTGDAPKP